MEARGVEGIEAGTGGSSISRETECVRALTKATATIICSMRMRLALSSRRFFDPALAIFFSKSGQGPGGGWGFCL